MKPDIQIKTLAWSEALYSSIHFFSTVIVSEHITEGLTVLADEGAGEDVGAVEGERGGEGDGRSGRVTVLGSLFKVVKDLDQQFVW